MGSLGPRYSVPFRGRRPERSVLWCAHSPGQNLTRLVRDKNVGNGRAHDLHPRSLRLHRESFPGSHSDQLVLFLLSITGRSIALGLSKVILRKLFVAVRPFPETYFLFFPAFIHRMSPVICARSEACSPRTFSLAKLDHCDCHGALKRRREYGACLRFSRDCR